MTEQEKKAMIDEMNRDKEGGSKKFWGPGSKEEGTFPIRFLPPMKKNEEKKFYFPHKVHFIGGIPFECLNQSFEDANGNYHEAESCPACKMAKKLYSTSERDSDEWKLAGQIKAKQRYISRIVVRGKEEETQPEFYEYGPAVWKKLYHTIVESDFGNITDAKNGRDFQLVKTGTGRNSNYDTSTPSAEVKPIFSDKESLVKVFENATQMKYNSLIEFPNREEMESSLNEYLHIEDEEPTPSPKPRPKKESKPEPAEEPVIDESDEEASNDDIDDILSEFTD